MNYKNFTIFFLIILIIILLLDTTSMKRTNNIMKSDLDAKYDSIKSAYIMLDSIKTINDDLTIKYHLYDSILQLKQNNIDSLIKELQKIDLDYEINIDLSDMSIDDKVEFFKQRYKE